MKRILVLLLALVMLLALTACEEDAEIPTNICPLGVLTHFPAI